LSDFGDNERGPNDDLKLQFEAVSQLNDDEKMIIREILGGLSSNIRLNAGHAPQICRQTKAVKE